MALKTEYTIESIGEFEIHKEAYIRIQKIQIANTEYEFFKNIDDPNRPDIAQEVDWMSRLESQVTCFVWPDEFARKNRAQSIDWFVFEFDYDLNSLDNIFQQAYGKLHEIFPNSEDVI